MALASFPASGSTSWYGWATSVDTSMRVQPPRGRYTKYVAASGETNAVKDLCDYVCTGTSDQNTINTAINAVASVTINRGGNGGKVVLVGRNFNYDGPIQMQTQTWLTSEYGKYATVLTRSGTYAPGATGAAIELASTAVQYTEVSGLTIQGGNASLSGIYYGVGTAQEFDAFHTIDDVYIWNVGQDGISLAQIQEPPDSPRNRGNMISRVRVINAGRYGINSNCPDSFYSMVDCGSSGSHGFNAAHSNNRYVNCKAWFSDGNGFHIAGGRDNQFSGCESQDNAGHGFAVNSPKNMLTSCMADSNGYTGTGDGFNVAGNGTIIQGCVASEKSEHTASQRYGYNISGTAKVFINGVAFGNTTGAVNGTGAAGSVVNVVSY